MLQAKPHRPLPQCFELHEAEADSSRELLATTDHQQQLATEEKPRVMTTIVFTLSDRGGAFAEMLSEKLIESGIKLACFESRPAKGGIGCYEVLIAFTSGPACWRNVERIMDWLKQEATSLLCLIQDQCCWSNKGLLSNEIIPSFPIRIADIDRCADHCLTVGNSELNADHPGFKDSAYRARRQEIIDLAARYRYGEKIPTVEYTQEELETWKKVYTRLSELYPRYACREFTYGLMLLEQNSGFGPNRIPQLQEVSDFLKGCSGFTLRPVGGYLSPREFLAGLAHRVFHSTQYIRHHERTDYTPEPDVCHDLLGHMPFFAQPEFAQFAQELGLASLGASDEMITQLTRLYWFTLEFGICMEDGEKKAYGAGILSSYGELQHCFTAPNEPKMRPFDVSSAMFTEYVDGRFKYLSNHRRYPISTYQPQYFVVNSFAEGLAEVAAWASAFLRSRFNFRYNPYTQRVELANN